jgi:hypothetical protein
MLLSIIHLASAAFTMDVDDRKAAPTAVYPDNFMQRQEVAPLFLPGTNTQTRAGLNVGAEVEVESATGTGTGTGTGVQVGTGTGAGAGKVARAGAAATAAPIYAAAAAAAGSIPTGTGSTIIPDSEVPRWAARYLYSHQQVGVRWLWEKYRIGQGAILGDDMGK